MQEDANLADLFEAAPGCIAVVRGPNHIFDVTNAAYRRLVGREDLIGRSAKDAMPELEAQGFLALLDRVYTSGEPLSAHSVPVELPGSNGTPLERRYISFVYQPIKNPAGEVTGIFAEGIDVTANTRAEVAKQEAERQLNAVLDNASVAIFLMDDKQHCSYMNAAAERLTGFTLAETQGRPLHDVIHHTRPDGSPFPLSECAIDRAFPEDNNVRGEEVFVHKDGHFYPIEFTASPVRDEASKTIGTIIEVRDVSAEKAADDELARTMERLAEERHALEVLNRTGAEVAAELNLEKVVQLVVDAGVELTGAQFGAFFYNVERQDGERLMLYTLAGASISDFENFGMPRPTPIFAPTFAGEGAIRSADITKDPRYGKNAPHRGMPKGHLPVRSYLSVPVASRSGEILGGLFFGHGEPDVFNERSERLMDGLAAQAAIAIDNARLFQAAERANEGLEKRVLERTAELEQAHEALRHAQKMEAIGQLTGGVAHDFNNLLTVIRGSADILSRPNLAEEKRARYVDAIAQTADRAAKLTSQLLAFARRQSLEPVVFDVVERIRAETEMLRPVMGSRIQVVVEAECDPCYVEVDPNQLETAILNMSVNARDAMDGEGRLTISVSSVTGVPASHGQEAMAGEFVAISISDTGSGVDADTIDRIFEPFFTTKGVGHGTGLGLSQVFGFAKQSGGDIRVSNHAGGGATFALYLRKVEHQDSGHIADVCPEEAERPVRGRVLVVEDNADVGAFARDLLNEVGYESVWVADAQAALDFLSSGARGIEVVFSDVVMPGMSGVDLAKEVRSRLPDMPIVLTSGYSHIIAEEGTHGFTLLRKPYSVDGLIKALQEAIV